MIDRSWSGIPRSVEWLAGGDRRRTYQYMARFQSVDNDGAVDTLLTRGDA